MTPSAWNLDNVYLNCTNFRVYIFFASFGQFRKIKYTQNFLLSGTRKNKYMLNMHKIHVSRNAQKNMHKNNSSEF